MIVIAVDPGVHNGVAVVELRREKSHTVDSRALGLPENRTVVLKKALTVEYPHFIDEFAELVRSYEGTRLGVAVEKYTATRVSMMGQQLQPVEVLGMVRAVLQLSARNQFRTVMLQTPGDAKTMYPTDKLVRTGFLAARHGLSDHAIDAIRHALLFAMRSTRA